MRINHLGEKRGLVRIAVESESPTEEVESTTSARLLTQPRLPGKPPKFSLVSPLVGGRTPGGHRVVRPRSRHRNLDHPVSGLPARAAGNSSAPSFAIWGSFRSYPNPS